MPVLSDPKLTTSGVLEAMYASGKTIRQWGRAIDGTPMLSGSISAGKQSAILITAGVHASETAGVQAALNLLSLLDTGHDIFILPLRDPFGFAGVNRCLSFAAQQPVRLANHIETLEYLNRQAKLLWSEDDIYIFKLNEVGFIWSPLNQEGFYRIIDRIGQLSRSNPEAFEPLWGKSVMLLNPDTGCEGASEMQRCWHGVFSEQGEWLHLNRFFGRPDPPLEVAALNRLIETIRPGLICDLQEDRESGFWLGIARPKQGADKMMKIGKAFLDVLHQQNAPILTYDDMLANNHADTAIPGLLLPEPRLPGMTWMDILTRGEGHNLLTFAATFTYAFGVESPMQRPLAERVDGITNGILASIKAWEETITGTG